MGFYRTAVNFGKTLFGQAKDVSQCLVGDKAPALANYIGDLFPGGAILKPLIQSTIEDFLGKGGGDATF